MHLGVGVCASLIAGSVPPGGSPLAEFVSILDIDTSPPGYDPQNEQLIDCLL